MAILRSKPPDQDTKAYVQELAQIYQQRQGSLADKVCVRSVLLCASVVFAQATDCALARG